MGEEEKEKINNLRFNEVIKKLTLLYPNDSELGEHIREYVKQYNCCAIKENHVKSGNNKMICKVCGEIINNN